MSKGGAISKAQKAQNIFLEKKLKLFEKIFSFEKSRIVPKNVKLKLRFFYRNWHISHQKAYKRTPSVVV